MRKFSNNKKLLPWFSTDAAPCIKKWLQYYDVA